MKNTSNQHLHQEKTSLVAFCPLVWPVRSEPTTTPSTSSPPTTTAAYISKHKKKINL
ncbi:hypothetical protein Hanom_Chr13g01182931 [Helianthus anomalus]